MSLANHGLQEIARAGGASSHVFDSPPNTGGNRKNRPSAIFVRRRKAKVVVLYCLTNESLDLFRLGGLRAGWLPDNFKKVCRAFCVFVLDEQGYAVIEDFGGTVRAQRELARNFGRPVEGWIALDAFASPNDAKRAA